MLAHLTAPDDRGTVFGVQSTAHSLGIMLSTAASGALIYRLGAAPATADWGVRGTFLGAAALSLLFVPACWAIVRRATAPAEPEGRRQCTVQATGKATGESLLRKDSTCRPCPRSTP